MNAIPKKKGKLTDAPIYLLIETVLDSLIEGVYFDEQRKQHQTITKDMLILEYIGAIPAFIKLCTIELSDIDKPDKYQIIDLVNMVYDSTSLYADARHAYLINLRNWLQKSKDANYPDAIKHVSAADVLVQTADLINYKSLSKNESKLVKKLHTVYDFDDDRLLIATLRTVAPSVVRLINNFSDLQLTSEITPKAEQGAQRECCWQEVITKWQDMVENNVGKSYLNAANAKSLSSCQGQQYLLETKLSSKIPKGM